MLIVDHRNRPLSLREHLICCAVQGLSVQPALAISEKDHQRSCGLINDRPEDIAWMAIAIADAVLARLEAEGANE
jgi:hypothetical protein